MGKCCSKNRDCLDQENRNQLQKKEKILRDHFSQNKLQKTSAADSVQKTLDN